MFPQIRFAALLLALITSAISAAPFSTNGNRLAYLDGDDPFYPGLNFPKLITPQWIGEDGVDAVVILSIDDMRNNEPKYEAMLRPIIARLKKIDGRAPVSIMVNTTSSTNELVKRWLAEGVSLECHTIAHPCPLCQKGDFAAASATYHDCVDLLNAISGNKPVAFRMPCCDSMNSPSPRFYSEIFNRTSAKTSFLSIDSSVMVVLTTNDTSLPRELVVDEQGRERFRKYLPGQTNATTRVSMGSFTTTIEDYPYPYVINKTSWEFPCIVPSDWEASNLHGSTNAATVRDWERALDAIVLKQGVMTFVFHPHGWIRAEQMVQFIDYATTKYGKRVKFLNFREAQERLNKNLLAGKSLRAADGTDAHVRVFDSNNDGLVEMAEFDDQQMKIYQRGILKSTTRNITLGPVKTRENSVSSWKFGVFEASGAATCVLIDSATRVVWTIRADGQVDSDLRFFDGLPAQLQFSANGRDLGVRFRDIDRDGVCEIVESRPDFSAIYKRGTNGWRKLDYALPSGTSIVDEQGRDAGLRFVDVDGDGYDDVLFSNHERYSLHLFRPDDRKLRLKPGWSDEIVSAKRENALTDPIPPIVRDGTNRNNGVWFARDTMWIQNEDTAHLPDKVDRRTFQQLLGAGNPPPLSPDAALKSMRVAPGFKIELVASEPLTVDPIGFEWGADGKLWVVEMNDYPLGVDGKGKGGGHVRLLEDTDGDGRYDKSTVFLEGLNYPTGAFPWRNGVIVSAAPEIFYAEDTDGNGKADKREVLFVGFTEGNQQHRINGFAYGLDGWLYAANGESGGSIRPAGASSSARVAVSMRGNDARFHPDKLLFEAVEGQSQHGRWRDDFGNWFANNNSVWGWHYYFPSRYLTRNPLLPLKTTKRTLATYPDAGRCYPVSRTVSRFNDPFAYNHVTSGNSPATYRDDLFSGDYAQSVFISEPVHNLIHREVLEPNGVTFKSHRASNETNSEFLASTDNWFRPTMIKTGPDGALYVADMYRLVIEHPEWIPKEMQRRLDLRAGEDKGRIYRIYPEGATLRRIPNLAKRSTAELVSALDSPNGWQRDTAQRLLIERRDGSVAPAIESLAKGAKSAKVRLQALWVLNDLGVLRDDVLRVGIRDGSAEVREHAVRLAGTSLVGDFLPLASDSSPRVRYQIAFTLGDLDDSRAAEALVKLASDADENIRNAALSSAPRHAKAMLAMVEKLPSDNRAAGALPMLKKLVANPPQLAKAVEVRGAKPISPEQRAERAKVLARYADVPRLAGDSKNGAGLFKQNCAQCHRLRGEGAEVGPDLNTMSGKPVAQLIEAILDPNAAVEDRYRSFTVTTKDDREFTGVISAETPTTITLRVANQPETTLLRNEVKEISASAMSLMPEGLESAFTPQQLADVIAYVVGR
jgi:putative membrane-bound dehydrogenase-like protein